mgnify:CR=1 FL=1
MSLIKKSFNLILFCGLTTLAATSYATDWDMNDPQTCRGGEANPYNPPLGPECSCVGDRIQCTFNPAS